ncbi:YgaP family membrane protein [Salinimicrobium gaetbulicola]|uniref:DUF2892 domain-containing protein n=1 Tax=Salinimicrobium gaetbulicola TaxID=999702 RepID=A0ABW3ID64_9FLAO
MERNLGYIDIFIRLTLVLILSALLFWEVVPNSLFLIFLVPAGTLFLTSLVAFCPIYTALGINTFKKSS